VGQPQLRVPRMTSPARQRPRHHRLPDPSPAPGLRRPHLLDLRGPARRHRRR
jgi:hypothetical protein